MKRMSSDTAAKVNTVAVAFILVAAGSVAAFAAYFLVNSNSGTYEITIEVKGMEVSCEKGSVYNVIHGSSYYDPTETDAKTAEQAFVLAEPSTIARLYMSAEIDSRVKYSDTVNRDVQKTSAVPSESAEISGNSIVFRTSSTDSQIGIAIFLLLKGYTNDPTMGTIVDIYSGSPGSSGVNYRVDLKEHCEDVTLKGNEDTDVKGLLRFTVTVKAV